MDSHGLNWLLDYETVEKAYMNVIFDHKEMIALSTGLALMFAVFNIMREAKKATEKQIDVAMIISLLREYGAILSMILFLPVAISTFEYLFGIVQKSYMNQFGTPNHSVVNGLWKETKEYMNTATSNITHTPAIFLWPALQFHVIQYMSTMVLKPTLTIIDNWSYGFALVYRFIFLGALKLTGGLAIACYIYEGTRNYFYTYIKNLAICYLLIPGFLFVTVFVDSIRNVFIGTASIQVTVLLLCVFLKLFGYSAVTKLLHQAI